MVRVMFPTIALAMALSGTAGSAQVLSDEEFLQRLRGQSDVLNQSSELGTTRGLGDTRGLELVTLGEEEASAAVTFESVEGAEATTTAVPADPNMPLVAVVFPEELTVDVSIQFEYDSAAITPSQRPALEQICRVLTMAEEIERFRIIGHTDAAGSDAYNQGLSQLRAEEVGRYLVTECGIAPSRLEMVGYGERFLARPEDPASAVNRRVEFQVSS